LFIFEQSIFIIGTSVLTGEWYQGTEKVRTLYLYPNLQKN